MQLGADSEKALCEELAFKNEQVGRYIDGRPIKKVIVVPNKLVNIVI
jgi:leucyl-tRNA synthetase